MHTELQDTYRKSYNKNSRGHERSIGRRPTHRLQPKQRNDAYPYVTPNTANRWFWFQSRSKKGHREIQSRRRNHTYTSSSSVSMPPPKPKASSSWCSEAGEADSAGEAGSWCSSTGSTGPTNDRTTMWSNRYTELK